MNNYSLYGLNISSDIPIDSLVEKTTNRPDVTIEIGPISKKG